MKIDELSSKAEQILHEQIKSLQSAKSSLLLELEDLKRLELAKVTEMGQSRVKLQEFLDNVQKSLTKDPDESVSCLLCRFSIKVRW